MASKKMVLGAIVVVAILLGVGMWAMFGNEEKDSSVTLTDAMGRSVTISETPESIISTSPAITEMIYAFDKSDSLIGVTSYCDYPEAVLSSVENGTIEIIGNFYTNLDTELIIGLSPDIVFMEQSVENAIAQISTLQAAGIPVVVLKQADGLETVLENFEMMGKALHDEEKAGKLAETMDAKFESVAEKIADVEAKPTVMMVVYWDSNSIWVAGNGSFTNEVMSRGGALNAFGNIDFYAEVTVEDIVMADPDVIIISGMALGNADVALSTLENDTLLKNLNAVKEGKVYVLLGQSENTFVRQGIRMVEGSYLCAMMLYPELFSETLPHTLSDDYKEYLPGTW